MPGRPKSGPPYPEVPEVYVVVIKPWGMTSTPRERGQKDFDRIGAWAQFVLRQAGVGGGRTPSIESIYAMGTRDEIIIQFPPRTDIIPLLGEHRWANIAKTWQGDPDDPRSTSVFIYNWRNNGDPANHNWSENFPGDPNMVVPAKSPYPSPSWTQPPTPLANFVHPIPRPLAPLPTPTNQDQAPQPSSSKTLPPKATPCASTPEPKDTTEVEQHAEDTGENSAFTSHFRPYEPPSQHPSHAQYLNPRRAREDDAPAPVPTPTTPQPEFKFVKKLDPYELEEDALRALKFEDEPVKLETIDSDIKPILPLASHEQPKFKVEADDSKPSVVSGSGSQRPRDLRRRPADPTIPPPFATQAPRKSMSAFEDEVNAYLASIGVTSSGTTHVSQTDSRSNTRSQTPQPPAPLRPQSHHSTTTTEFEDEVNAYLASIGTTSSNGGDANVSPAAVPQSNNSVSVKREYEDVEFEFSGKRIKIEEP